MEWEGLEQAYLPRLIRGLLEDAGALGRARREEGGMNRPVGPRDKKQLVECSGGSCRQDVEKPPAGSSARSVCSIPSEAHRARCICA